MYPRGGACTVSVAYPAYGFAAGNDIPGLLAMANGPKENLEKRSENSLFLMLYVLLYIC